LRTNANAQVVQRELWERREALAQNPAERRFDQQWRLQEETHQQMSAYAQAVQRGTRERQEALAQSRIEHLKFTEQQQVVFAEQFEREKASRAAMHAARHKEYVHELTLRRLQQPVVESAQILYAKAEQQLASQRVQDAQQSNDDLWRQLQERQQRRAASRSWGPTRRRECTSAGAASATALAAAQGAGVHSAGIVMAARANPQIVDRISQDPANCYAGVSDPGYKKPRRPKADSHEGTSAATREKDICADSAGRPTLASLDTNQQLNLQVRVGEKESKRHHQDAPRSDAPRSEPQNARSNPFKQADGSSGQHSHESLAHGASPPAPTVDDARLNRPATTSANRPATTSVIMPPLPPSPKECEGSHLARSKQDHEAPVQNAEAQTDHTGDLHR